MKKPKLSFRSFPKIKNPFKRKALPPVFDQEPTSTEPAAAESDISAEVTSETTRPSFTPPPRVIELPPEEPPTERVSIAKTKFSTSEIFFLIIGMLFVAGSVFLLKSGHSFVPAEVENPTDPFGGSYAVVAPTPTPTPTPEPTPVPTPTPTPLPTATPKPKPKPVAPDAFKVREKAYLLLPKARALFSKTNILNKPFEMTFKFEVDPKRTPCTFQLEFEEKVILAKKLKPSPTGTFQLRMQFKKPGRYTWQIVTARSKSEKRELIIKP